MPRHIVELSFPESLKIPVNDEGVEICRMIATIDEEDSVTWVRSDAAKPVRRVSVLTSAQSPEVKSPNRKTYQRSKVQP